MRRRRSASIGFRVAAAACIALALAGAAPEPARAGDVAFTPDFGEIEPAFFPLEPGPVGQPVLTAADIDDAFAFFCADPFLVRDKATWLLFFEVTIPQGVIALASSADGWGWQYERIVLDEPFQLSYPHVFQVDGDWYMTPESASQQSVRLYRATAFPDGWTHVADLATGRPFADPTVFRHDGLWWMFVGNGASDTCWLYYSRLLDSEWVEHPQSPIVAGNRGRARPGGRVVKLSDGRMYRIAQNSSPTYGRAARAFQIDVLSTTAYAEHEIAASPLVEASGSGWNEDGMHHVDPWWTGSEWLVAVDGLRDGVWSIGMYRAPPAPTGTLPAVLRAPLHAAPNPTRGGTVLHWEPPAAARGRAVEITVHAASGRRVASRLLPPGTTRWLWDGTDVHGRPVAAGVYFCRLSGGAAGARTRVVVAR